MSNFEDIVTDFKNLQNNIIKNLDYDKEIFSLYMSFDGSLHIVNYCSKAHFTDECKLFSLNQVFTRTGKFCRECFIASPAKSSFYKTLEIVTLAKETLESFSVNEDLSSETFIKFCFEAVERSSALNQTFSPLPLRDLTHSTYLKILEMEQILLSKSVSKENFEALVKACEQVIKETYPSEDVLTLLENFSFVSFENDMNGFGLRTKRIFGERKYLTTKFVVQNTCQIVNQKSFITLPVEMFICLGFREIEEDMKPISATLTETQIEVAKTLFADKNLSFKEIIETAKSV